VLTSAQRARTELALKQSFSKSIDKPVPEDGASAAWAELIAKYVGTPGFAAAVALSGCIRELVFSLKSNQGGVLRHSDLTKLCPDEELASLVARTADGKLHEDCDSWFFVRVPNAELLEINQDAVATYARAAFPLM